MSDDTNDGDGAPMSGPGFRFDVDQQRVVPVVMHHTAEEICEHGNVHWSDDDGDEVVEWKDEMGRTNARRVQAGVSVGGGNRRYAARYDEMDWGDN